MVVGKVSWSPAVDRCADVLVGADDDSKDDEKHDSIAVVKSINQVVVIAGARTCELGNCRQHSIHRDCQSAGQTDSIDVDADLSENFLQRRKSHTRRR